MQQNKRRLHKNTRHSHLLAVERGWRNRNHGSPTIPVRCRVASEATINTRRVKLSLRARRVAVSALAQSATQTRRRRGPADAQTPPARPAPRRTPIAPSAQMAQKRNRARRFGCAVAVSALQAPTVAPRRTNVIVNGGRTATPLGRTKTLAGKEKIVASVQEDIEGADLIVFSELFLTGYPPEDLVLKGAFQRTARAAAIAASLPPGIPFKHFVAQLDESVTAEEAIALWREYHHGPSKPGAYGASAAGLSAPSAAVAWVASAHTDGDDVVARVAHSPVSFHR